MNKKQILKITFLSIASLIIIALVLEVVAMVYYPGGCHVATEYPDSFDFIYNTLTDLGRNPTPSGKPSLISQPLYQTAIFLMSFFGIVYHSIIWMYFRKNELTGYSKANNILSIAGSFFGVAQGGLYIGVLFVQKHPEHNQFIGAAAGSLIVSVLLYTIVLFRNKDLPKIHKWGYLSICIIAMIYVIIIVTGLLIKNAGGSNVLEITSQRIGHTIFNWFLKISFVIQSVAIYFFIKSKEVKTDFER
ncbi:MAG: hypothetical protein ACTSQF_01670 [Candidatus Heimdallarchaeaceae archaeon]